MRELLLNFTPIISVVCFALGLSKLLNRQINHPTLSLLTATCISPLVISCLIQTLFLVFPVKPDVFYTTILNSASVISLLVGKNIKIPHFGIKNIKFTAFEKFLVAASLFIIVTIFVRSVFWTISWDDQLYYIQQAYAYSELKLPINNLWGKYFDNGIIRYWIDPMVRPGLTTFFTSSFLYNNSFKYIQNFTQLTMYGYFLAFIGIIYLLTIKLTGERTTAMLSIFLSLYTFQFIYHNIIGFKEIILIDLVLLELIYLFDNSISEIRKSVLIGVLTGAGFLINYSGIVIAGILLGSVFIFYNKPLKQRLLFILLISAVSLTIGGGEIYSFLKSTLFTPITYTSILASPADTQELSGYNISTNFDYLAKGKFQGFFQFQFYGIIFWMFLLVLLLNIQKIYLNKQLRLITFFILSYSFVFFDPLGINKFYYSYILAISHKYHVFMVPFTALIVSSQWSGVNNFILKIPKKVYLFLLGMGLTFFIVISFNKSFIDVVFKLLTNIMAVHRNNDYYFTQLVILFRLLALGLLVSLIFLIFIKKEGRPIIFLFLFVILPNIFFINSNFGFFNILRYSFSSKFVQNQHIPGWESVYQITRLMDSIPNSDLVALIDQTQKYWQIRSNKLSSSMIEVKSKVPNLEEFIQLYKVKYILARNELNLTKLTKVLQNESGIIYKVI